MKIANLRLALIAPAVLVGMLTTSVLIGPSARADDVKAGDLAITEAWSRATPVGAKTGAGFLTIENKGATSDRLIGATTDAAGRSELHEMAMNNGVMTMRPVEKGLVIEPGKSVRLAPGGYHLMLTDLKRPLKQGEKLPITLDFERAGKVQVTLEVQAVGAPGPSGAAGGMQMRKMTPGMKM